MIQILALRDFPRKDGTFTKAEQWFDKGLRAASVEQIFASPLELIRSVPESERHNVYYTVAECLEEKGRKLKSQNHIPFDVDGIDPPNLGDETSLVPMARLICAAIGVKYEETGVLYTGNGLQLIVGTTHTIEDEDFFDKWRSHYKAICDRIDFELKKAGFKGKSDTSVFSKARLMRFPCTQNIKPNKPTRTGVILNGTIVRSGFRVEVASGVPVIPPGDQVSERILLDFPTPDAKTILAECKFLQWNFAHPEEVDEPKWYAALSIVSRLPNGDELCHKMSEGHPSYTFEGTQRKIEQAKISSGPRTCKNIGAISDKCLTCPHFGSGLTSPILLEGPDHIKTENSGFHFVSFNEAGKVKKTKPDYEGLVRFLARKHHFKVIDESKFVMRFNGKYFEEMRKEYLYRFAQEHFDPKPLTPQRIEFYNHVLLNNLVTQDFFSKETTGLMNFQNGVFNLKTRELSPHSTEYGFRSLLPCNYEADATCSTFLKFIDDVTLGRKELIDVLQEYLGYVFGVADCRYEKALLLVGDGANGKSTLARLIADLAGKDNTSNMSFTALSSDQNRVMLYGKMLNVSEENSRHSFKDADFIKNFISGGMIGAKRVYHEPFEFQNTAKLLMLCNKLPFLKDATYGFRRKFIILPFDAVFDDSTKDISIGEKLKKELPGIFNWIMQGYDRLIAKGRFTESEIVNQISEDYREAGDMTYSWLREACVLDVDAATNRKELRDSYLSWCLDNGIRNNHFNPKEFYQDVRNLIIQQTKIPKGKVDTKTDGDRGFRGLRILPTEGQVKL